MFQNKKNVFWEALLLTILIFIIGMLLGVAFEKSQVKKADRYYVQSEIALMDILALNEIVNLESSSCDVLIESNIQFANTIYEEAQLLEKYEEAGKITDDLKLAHKKYDILRTFLWLNLIKIKEKCGKDINSVIYLYEFESDDLTKRAIQKVWSRVLYDLKQEKGNEIILVPVAADRNLTSVDSLISRFKIQEFPAVIINDKHVVMELSSAEELYQYF